MFVDLNSSPITLFYHIFGSYLFHRTGWHEHTLIYLKKDKLVKDLVNEKLNKEDIVETNFNEEHDFFFLLNNKLMEKNT